MQKAANDRGLCFVGDGLEPGVPVSVGTVANGDEARNEDSGSGSECYESEVHSISPLARATGHAGIAAL